MEARSITPSIATRTVCDFVRTLCRKVLNANGRIFFLSRLRSGDLLGCRLADAGTLEIRTRASKTSTRPRVKLGSSSLYDATSAEDVGA
jgi:hypothetical protein